MVTFFTELERSKNQKEIVRHAKNGFVLCYLLPAQQWDITSRLRLSAISSALKQLVLCYYSEHNTWSGSSTSPPA
eukprot:6306644-Pyramimonas_sp.AAC.1